MRLTAIVGLLLSLNSFAAGLDLNPCNLPVGTADQLRALQNIWERFERVQETQNVGLVYSESLKVARDIESINPAWITYLSTPETGHCNTEGNPVAMLLNRFRQAAGRAQQNQRTSITPGTFRTRPHSHDLDAEQRARMFASPYPNN